MIGNAYSHTVQPLTALIHTVAATGLPGLPVKLIFVLHALRLTLAYHATTQTRPSWVLGMLSVCAMPISGGLVAGLLTSTVPPFLLSDSVIPTYMATYILVHIALSVLSPSRLQRVRWAKTIGLVTMPIDAILKCSNFCIAGVDALKFHPLSGLRNTLFAPIFVAGAIGSAGYLTMHTLGLFSTWQFSAMAFEMPQGLEWDLWGPYALSLLYIALQGSDERVNTATRLLSRGSLSAKTRFFNQEEARTLVICAQIAVQLLKFTGIWLGRLPFTAQPNVAQMHAERIRKNQ